MTAKTCTQCQKAKPVDSFPSNKRAADGRHQQCKTCLRVAMAQYRQTEQYRETISAYLADPDVQRRRKTADEKRRYTRRSQQRAYRSTPRAKLLHCRRQARIRLRQATTEKRRNELRELIAAYTAEIERIDAA